MSFPIDPPRRSPPVRRAKKVDRAQPEAGEDDEVDAAEAASLPVPVSPPRAIPSSHPATNPATIQAQIIGERRGLRAGATIHDQAKVTYNRTEWSGKKDRRAPKGGSAKTDV
ncbi:MAG: hypothetical protein JSS35_20670 [Proteobacteria bacterium]|nr:hypothetical protein [Pseudomonadota bacterium]